MKTHVKCVFSGNQDEKRKKWDMEDLERCGRSENTEN